MSFRIRLTHPAAPLAAAPSHARRGNSRCGAGLVRNLLRGMVCAVLTVQMLTGCARSTPQEPVQWDLSPEAQRTYATLLLDQSIRGDDKEGVLEAVKLLLTLENRPQPFIDAAAWLMLNRETSEARSRRTGRQARARRSACTLLPKRARTGRQRTGPQDSERIPRARTPNSCSRSSASSRQAFRTPTGARPRSCGRLLSICPRAGPRGSETAHRAIQPGSPYRKAGIRRRVVRAGPPLKRTGNSRSNEIYNGLIEQDPDNPDIWIRMVEGQIRAGKGRKRTTP
ncbi:MAG: hypothetical protein ACLSAH_20690 [Bilophila wadsworthia]